MTFKNEIPHAPPPNPKDFAPVFDRDAPEYPPLHTNNCGLWQLLDPIRIHGPAQAGEKCSEHLAKEKYERGNSGLSWIHCCSEWNRSCAPRDDYKEYS